MKASEVDQTYLIDYLRLDEPEECVKREINAALAAGMAFIRSYTGLDDAEIDRHEDMTAALLVLVADMFENKNYYIDYKSREVNRTVETILGMYSTNLL